MVYVSRFFAPASSGISAGDIEVGKVVRLNENGTPVDYLVVNQGIPEDSPLYDASCEGTWLLRKDIRENVVWNTNDVNTLPNSAVIRTMDGYVTDYDDLIQSAIKTIKIPYCLGNSSVAVNSGKNGLECKLFPLSGYEFGLTVSDNNAFPVDGAKLDYFLSGNTTDANNKRIANLNGIPSGQWTRSPVASKSDGGRVNIFTIVETGRYSSGGAIFSYGLRPALILPYDFQFTKKEVLA